MMVRVLVVASLALVAGALAEQVRADEIFVCEDGRQLRVASRDIEQAIKTEPCVAAHFGQTAPTAAGAPTGASGIALPVANPRRAGLRTSANEADVSGRRTGSFDLSAIVVLNAGAK